MESQENAIGQYGVIRISVVKHPTWIIGLLTEYLHSPFIIYYALIKERPHLILGVLLSDDRGLYTEYL